MKRIVFIILLLVCMVLEASAQTATATCLYQEATADKLGVEHFLKQDFAEVDSISMYDLGVLFYREKQYAYSGICWEIALKKVKKHGKTYEQIVEALSSAYLELGDNQKIQWLMAVIEEHNQEELKKECNDYKCKLEQAQYYIVHGEEAMANMRIKESLDLCQTDEQRIEVEEAYAQLLSTVSDFESSAQYYLSASRRWKALGTNVENMGVDMYWAAVNYSIAMKYNFSEARAHHVIDTINNKYFFDVPSDERKSKLIDLYKSNASVWYVKDDMSIYPPFSSIDGLGTTVANNIVNEREKQDFFSIEDVQTRAKVSQTLIDKMRVMGVFKDMPETSQLSLF